MSDPPIIAVEWIDAMGLNGGGWMDADEIDEALTLDALRQEATGYLVKESSVAIALAGTRNASAEDDRHRNSRFGDVRVIPRVMLLGKPKRLTPRGKMAPKVKEAQ